MKVTLKYEESAEKDAHMTLRLTLPQKYVDGKTRAVVQLFVDHYNKKRETGHLDAEGLHIKIVGGNHLDKESRVRDTMNSGDECFLLPDGVAERTRAAPEAEVAAAAPAVGAPAANTASTASAASGSRAGAVEAPSAARKSAVATDERGRVRCKNFGCQNSFDPNDPPPCVHHKAPPIFHEVAKWWSCCPDRKAYDFDDFMKIPGCVTGVCSSESQQGQKRFLGGTDIRGQNAPVRLDENAPEDPRRKLNDLRKGLVAIGVDGALFDKVWASVQAEDGDAEKCCEKFRMRFAQLLSKADV